MHQPQFTQLLDPIGLLSSKLMLVRPPLPMRPMTKFPATSLHARTHRSHRMHELWSTAMLKLEKSVPFVYARGVYMGSSTPYRSPTSSSSQSCVSWCRRHGRGCSERSNSMIVLRL